jgi:hypothetical protein
MPQRPPRQRLSSNAPASNDQCLSTSSFEPRVEESSYRPPDWTDHLQNTRVILKTHMNPSCDIVRCAPSTVASVAIVATWNL